MGRVAVRAAVVNYLTTGINDSDIPHLAVVKPSPPKVMSRAAVFGAISVGSATGAWAFVHIERQIERRVELTGPSAAENAHSVLTNPGGKIRSYIVGLEIFTVSAQPQAEQADADNDALLDGLVGWIEQDRTFGGTLYEAGEGPEPGAMGDDIDVTSNLPVLSKTETVNIYNLVRFNAHEWVPPVYV